MEPSARRRSRSGPNIPAHQRGDVMYQARVSPEIRATLRALAARWRMSHAELLSELLRRCGVDVGDEGG